MLCCEFKLLSPTFVNVFILCLPSGSVSSCDAFLNVFQSHGLKPEVICPCATSPEALTVAIRRYNVNHTNKEINRETCAFTHTEIGSPLNIYSTLFLNQLEKGKL